MQIINVLFFLLSCGSPLHPWYSAPAPVWITNYCEDHYNHCVLDLHTVRGLFRLLLRCSLRWSQITERRRRRWQVSGGATEEWGNFKTNLHIGIICSVASYWLHKSIADSQQTLAHTVIYHILYMSYIVLLLPLFSPLVYQHISLQLVMIKIDKVKHQQQSPAISPSPAISTWAIARLHLPSYRGSRHMEKMQICCSIK